MTELFPLAISFAIGITCSLMACCIAMYMGLFAHLNSTAERPSRLRAGFTSLGFAGGLLLVVAAIGAGFTLLRIALTNSIEYWINVIDVVGLVILSIIGASYLTGKSKILLPQIGPPAMLTRMRGYPAAPMYGIFFGGPGAAHCTLTIVIPIIFLSLSSLDPVSIIGNFLFYAIGRIIPIVAIGMMFQDAQVRFIKLVSAHSQLLNRVIGITIIISGVSLFFIR